MDYRAHFDVQGPFKGTWTLFFFVLFCCFFSETGSHCEVFNRDVSQFTFYTYYCDYFCGEYILVSTYEIRQTTSEIFEIIQRRNKVSINASGGQRGKKCWHYGHILKREPTGFTDELCKI